jgi:hypothetical protein
VKVKVETYCNRSCFPLLVDRSRRSVSNGRAKRKKNASKNRLRKGLDDVERGLTSSSSGDDVGSIKMS